MQIISRHSINLNPHSRNTRNLAAEVTPAVDPTLKYLCSFPNFDDSEIVQKLATFETLEDI